MLYRYQLGSQIIACYHLKYVLLAEQLHYSSKSKTNTVSEERSVGVHCRRSRTEDAAHTVSFIVLRIREWLAYDLK